MKLMSHDYEGILPVVFLKNATKLRFSETSFYGATGAFSI